MRQTARPVRPQQPAQREPLKTIIGCYHWNPDRTGYDPARDENLLRWGQRTVVQLGAPMIRVYLGVADGYQLGLRRDYRLWEIAHHPAYRQLFVDPSLTDYLLTTYSQVCDAHEWADNLSQQEAAQVRREFFELAKYLAAQYPHKRFVLLNWETDNAIEPFLNQHPNASGELAAWLAARVQGVRQAQTTNVRCGVELSHVLPGWDYFALTEIIPKMSVRPDYLSLSAWDVFNPRTPDEIAHNRWQQAQQMLALRGWRANEIIIGELGYFDQQDGSGLAAQRLAWALNELSGRVAYVTYWQARDSRPNDGDGLISATGGLSEKIGVFQQAVGSEQLLMT